MKDSSRRSSWNLSFSLFTLVKVLLPLYSASFFCSGSFGASFFLSGMSTAAFAASFLAVPASLSIFSTVLFAGLFAALPCRKPLSATGFRLSCFLSSFTFLDCAVFSFTLFSVAAICSFSAFSRAAFSCTALFSAAFCSFATLSRAIFSLASFFSRAAFSCAAFFSAAFRSFSAFSRTIFSLAAFSRAIFSCSAFCAASFLSFSAFSFAARSAMPTSIIYAEAVEPNVKLLAKKAMLKATAIFFFHTLEHHPFRILLLLYRLFSCVSLTAAQSNGSFAGLPALRGYAFGVGLSFFMTRTARLSERPGKATGIDSIALPPRILTALSDSFASSSE